MASTNKTTHYELSQYLGSDKPTYLGDYNSDMSKIDAQMYQNATNAQTGITNASNAQTRADNAYTLADTANTAASTADSKATQVGTNVGALTDLTTSDKSDIVSAINELNSLIATTYANIQDELYYKNNDEFTTLYTITSDGFISGGSTTIWITIPLPKRMDNITDVDILSMNIVARGTSGYVDNASSYFSVTGSNYTITKAINGNELSLTIAKNTSFTNVTNNTPVSVQIQGGFSLKFRTS